MIPKRIRLTRPKTNKAKMTANITQMIPINERFTFFESPCFIPLIRQTNSRKDNIAPTITDILAIPVSEFCKMLAKKKIFISIFTFNYFYLRFFFFTPVRVNASFLAVHNLHELITIYTIFISIFKQINYSILFETELNGFEPSKQHKPFNALAGRPDQPLWHNSKIKTC